MAWIPPLLLFIACTALTLWLESLGLPPHVWFTTAVICYGGILAYVGFGHRQRFISAWHAFRHSEPAMLAPNPNDGFTTHTVEPRQQSAWNVARQQALRSMLAGYANGHVNVKVLFAHPHQRGLADSLISVFELAGWHTNLTTVPLDRWLNDSGYFDGVEVRGFNKHLVESVAQSVTDAGLRNVRSRLDDLKITIDNPKHSWALQSIRLTIGHQSADRFAHYQGSAPFRFDVLHSELLDARLPICGGGAPKDQRYPPSPNAEDFKLADGRFIRVDVTPGQTLTAEQRIRAHEIILVHEAQLKR